MPHINRRRFLQTLATSVAAGMVLDPERLLWVPGQVKIFDLGAVPPLTDEWSPLDYLAARVAAWNNRMNVMSDQDAYFTRGVLHAHRLSRVR